MSKKTIVKLYPLLVIYAAILALGAWFYVNVFLIPWRLEDILPAWLLSDILFLVSFYSFLYIFIFSLQRTSVWLEIVPRETLECKKPLLEWFSVVTVFAILTLPVSRLSYYVGLSDIVSTIFLWILLYAVWAGLVKRLPLVSVFSRSNS